MKCQICDGTGTSNTCVNGTFKPCSFCDGTGEFDPNEVDRFNAVDVIKVMEMIKKPQTNEEMLRGCTFEEMAGAIYEWYSQGHIEGKVGKQLSSVTRVVEWLKEKHDGNVL